VWATSEDTLPFQENYEKYKRQDIPFEGPLKQMEQAMMYMQRLLEEESSAAKGTAGSSVDDPAAAGSSTQRATKPKRSSATTPFAAQPAFITPAMAAGAGSSSSTATTVHQQQQQQQQERASADSDDSADELHNGTESGADDEPAALDWSVLAAAKWKYSGGNGTYLASEYFIRPGAKLDKHFKLGTDYFVSLADVEAWLSKNPGKLDEPAVAGANTKPAASAAAVAAAFAAAVTPSPVVAAGRNHRGYTAAVAATGDAPTQHSSSLGATGGSSSSSSGAGASTVASKSAKSKSRPQQQQQQQQDAVPAHICPVTAAYALDPKKDAISTFNLPLQEAGYVLVVGDGLTSYRWIRPGVSPKGVNAAVKQGQLLKGVHWFPDDGADLLAFLRKGDMWLSGKWREPIDTAAATAAAAAEAAAAAASAGEQEEQPARRTRAVSAEPVLEKRAASKASKRGPTAASTGATANGSSGAIASSGSDSKGKGKGKSKAAAAAAEDTEEEDAMDLSDDDHDDEGDAPAAAADVSSDVITPMPEKFSHLFIPMLQPVGFQSLNNSNNHAKESRVYIRPGVLSDGVTFRGHAQYTKNLHYFETEEALLRWLRKNWDSGAWKLPIDAVVGSDGAAVLPASPSPELARTRRPAAATAATGGSAAASGSSSNRRKAATVAAAAAAAAAAKKGAAAASKAGSKRKTNVASDVAAAAEQLPAVVLAASAAAPAAAAPVAAVKPRRISKLPFQEQWAEVTKYGWTKRTFELGNTAYHRPGCAALKTDGVQLIPGLHYFDGEQQFQEFITLNDKTGHWAEPCDSDADVVPLSNTGTNRFGESPVHKKSTSSCSSSKKKRPAPATAEPLPAVAAAAAAAAVSGRAAASSDVAGNVAAGESLTPSKRVRYSTAPDSASSSRSSSSSGSVMRAVRSSPRLAMSTVKSTVKSKKQYGKKANRSSGGGSSSRVLRSTTPWLPSVDRSSSSSKAAAASREAPGTLLQNSANDEDGDSPMFESDTPAAPTARHNSSSSSISSSVDHRSGSAAAPVSNVRDATAAAAAGARGRRGAPTNRAPHPFSIGSGSSSSSSGSSACDDGLAAAAAATVAAMTAAAATAASDEAAEHEEMESEGWTVLSGTFSSSPTGYIKPGGSSTVPADIFRHRDDARAYRQQLKAAAAAAAASGSSKESNGAAADDSSSDGEEHDGSSSSSTGGTTFASLQRPAAPIASALFGQQRSSGSRGGSSSSSSSSMAAPTPRPKTALTSAGDATADKADVAGLLAETPLHSATGSTSYYTGTPLDRGDHVRGDVSADVHSDGEHSSSMDTNDDDADANTAAAELTQLQVEAEAPGATFAEPITEPETEPITEPITEPATATADASSDSEEIDEGFAAAQLQQPPTALELLEQERQQLLALGFTAVDSDTRGWAKLSSKQGGWRCSANGLSGERYRKPGVSSRAGVQGVDWFRTHTAAVAYAKSVLDGTAAAATAASEANGAAAAAASTDEQYEYGGGEYDNTADDDDMDCDDVNANTNTDTDTAAEQQFPFTQLQEAECDGNESSSSSSNSNGSSSCDNSSKKERARQLLLQQLESLNIAAGDDARATWKVLNKAGWKLKSGGLLVNYKYTKPAALLVGDVQGEDWFASVYDAQQYIDAVLTDTDSNSSSSSSGGGSSGGSDKRGRGRPAKRARTDSSTSRTRSGSATTAATASTTTATAKSKGKGKGKAKASKQLATTATTNTKQQQQQQRSLPSSPAAAAAAAELSGDSDAEGVATGNTTTTAVVSTEYTEMQNRMFNYTVKADLGRLDISADDSLSQMWAKLSSAEWTHSKSTGHYYTPDAPADGCEGTHWFADLAAVRAHVLELLDMSDDDGALQYQSIEHVDAAGEGDDYDSDDPDTVPEEIVHHGCDAEADADSSSDEQQQRQQRQPRLQAALLALQQTYTAQRLPEREQEFSAVHSAITSAIAAGTGSSVYVCGSPGTGKTSTLQQIRAAVVQWCKQHSELCPTYCYVNAATAVTQPAAVYGAILEAVKSGATADAAGAATECKLAPAEARKQLEALLFKAMRKNSSSGSGSSSSGSSSGSSGGVPMIVLTVDEMDKLARAGAKELQQLFQWAHTAKSRLILIGIANSIDLPQTIAGLQQQHIAPVQVVFTAYTKSEIESILSARVGAAVQQRALELCSKKVSNAGGDARCALMQCIDAVQIALSDSSSSADEVTVGHMRQALQRMTGTSSKDYICGQPQGCQVLLCIAAAMLSGGGNESTVTARALEQKFAAFCDKKSMFVSDGGVSAGQFETLYLSLIEVGLLVDDSAGTKQSRQSVRMQITSEHIKVALGDTPFYTSIMKS
jgi:cell division control protein 6